MNILFVIDELEFKYFEFNKLVTSFWLIAGFIKRGYKVDITTKNKLFLNFTTPMGLTYKTALKNNDLIKTTDYTKTNLNDYNVIFFRPDPPVDNDFINATYILDYIDKKTLILNSPQSLRNTNEKLYINNFPEIIPQNIVTSDDKLIREFLYEKKEIVIKPLNCCFSKGVFYLHDKDKNIHTIIDMATNSGKTMVMIQEFLPDIKQGDKRLVYIDGEIFEECVGKIHGNDDFKFNTHSDEYFKQGEITHEERKIANYIKNRMEADGLYIAGLDVINGKVIEINITSPCFFIKEVNQLFGIKFEDKISDKLENLIKRKIN